MKKFLAIFLSAVLMLSAAGCSSNKSSVPEDMISGEDIILSREDEEPLVSQSEYPDTDDSEALKSSSSSESSSSSQSAASSESSSSSQAPSSQAESSSSSSQPESTPESSEEPEQESASPTISGEVRAIWISYLDLAPMIKGKSKSQFQSNIGAAFDDCADLGLNTVIVQVRPFADALYDSAYFPWSYLVNSGNIEGKSPGYDPLQVMVSAAHSRGLKIEAWINPYRVRANGSKVSLCDDNQAQQWLDEGSDNVVEFNGGIYYNPAREEVQDLIVNGVEEIVSNYDVDGIHFDDYFYPSPDNSFDSAAYKEYKNAGGGKSLGDWRRSNVDTLVKRVYKAIKSIDSSCTFGISPQGNRSNNWSHQYIDVEKWVTNTGYVDYICPQIYWGYNNSSAPYQSVLEEWNDLIGVSKVKLYVGLAAYKIGNSESDFIGNSNMMKRQVVSAREQSRYQGFALYRYDSLFNPDAGCRSQVAKELKNLESILD